MAEGLCAPFDHNLVIDRLRDQAKVLKHIGGAAELGTITQLRDFRTPAAYVLLAQETLAQARRPCWRSDPTDGDRAFHRHPRGA